MRAFSAPVARSISFQRMFAGVVIRLTSTCRLPTRFPAPCRAHVRLAELLAREEQPASSSFGQARRPGHGPTRLMPVGARGVRSRWLLLSTHPGGEEAGGPSVAAIERADEARWRARAPVRRVRAHSARERDGRLA